MKHWLWLIIALSSAACSLQDAGANPPYDGPNPSRSGRWSDPTIWPTGQVPRQGEVVNIPPDLAVTLDVNPPGLKGLNIYGVLRFDNKDLQLSTDWIMVHGKLEIGTPSQPFRNRAVLTLTGNDPNENIMGMGSKVIGVMKGGVLDLHGEPRNGWTKLSGSVAAGSNRIIVLDSSGW